MAFNHAKKFVGDAIKIDNISDGIKEALGNTSVQSVLEGLEDHASKLRKKLGIVQPWLPTWFASKESAGVKQELTMAQAPSFFSLWIGNNDVLGYAIGEFRPKSNLPEWVGAAAIMTSMFYLKVLL